MTNLTMIQTNIKKLLTEAGIEEARPTDDALVKMRISRRRFTQLLENKHKTEISVQELEAIRSWIEGLKDIDTNRLVGGDPNEIGLTERLGLTK